MSLGCGACRRFDFDTYYMLYLLEEENGKLDYIDEFERHVSPSSCICPRCVGNAFELGKSTPEGLESGFALLPASSAGSPKWSDILLNKEAVTYLDTETASEKWPRAIEIIDGQPRVRPSPDNLEFTQKLFDHLRTGTIKFYAMAELGPSIVVVHDNHGSDRGELDVYFDLQDWGPKNPELWGDSLSPGGLKKRGLGVLSGVAFARRPQNFQEFLGFAKEVLSPKKTTEWYDAPRRFKFPREISVY